MGLYLSGFAQLKWYFCYHRDRRADRASAASKQGGSTSNQGGQEKGYQVRW